MKILNIKKNFSSERKSSELPASSFFPAFVFLTLICWEQLCLAYYSKPLGTAEQRQINLGKLWGFVDGNEESCEGNKVREFEEVSEMRLVKRFWQGNMLFRKRGEEERKHKTVVSGRKLIGRKKKYALDGNSTLKFCSLCEVKGTLWQQVDLELVYGYG